MRSLLVRTISDIGGAVLTWLRHIDIYTCGHVVIGAGYT